MRHENSGGSIPERIRWWVQRRRKAYRRPIYTNGECACPRGSCDWTTEDRRPRGMSARQIKEHEPWRARWHVMVVCRRCRAVRCGDSLNPKPCILQRHHRGDHRYV